MPLEKNREKIKVKAILMQIFCKVVSTLKCRQWNKLYLLYFRRMKSWSRGELMLGWLTHSGHFCHCLQ